MTLSIEFKMSKEARDLQIHWKRDSHLGALKLISILLFVFINLDYYDCWDRTALSQRHARSERSFVSVLTIAAIAELVFWAILIETGFWHAFTSIHWFDWRTVESLKNGCNKQKFLLSEVV